MPPEVSDALHVCIHRVQTCRRLGHQERQVLQTLALCAYACGAAWGCGHCPRAELAALVALSLECLRAGIRAGDGVRRVPDT